MAKAKTPVIQERTCSTCLGQGVLEEKRTVIAQKDHDKHMAEHFNVRRQMDNTGKLGGFIDADCDCARTTSNVKITCGRCSGSGRIRSWS